MANKAFEIQGSTLRIGGVELQAGTTSVVIPGVTQATSYSVEEVNDTGDQTYNGFPTNSQVTVYDHVQKNYQGGSDTPPTFATYLATTDDEGYIDEIQVVDGGSYTSQESADNTANNMWAWVPSETAYTYTQADMTDPYGLYVFQSGGHYDIVGDRSKWIDGTKLDNLLAQTPPMVATVFLVGDTQQYVFSLLVDPNGGSVLQGQWLPTPPVPGSVAIESIAFGYTESDFQIPFRPKMRAGAVETIGGGSSTHIEYYDEGRDYTSTVDLTANFSADVDRAHLDINGDGTWEIGSNNFDTKIFSTGDTPNNLVVRANDFSWTFNSSGHVAFPDGSVQVTAYTGGTGDDNIWVETFSSDAPTIDFVQAATSVEYDVEGNVIALFSHNEPGNNSTYNSVAKLTPTGAVLWQVRFGSNLNTDGWGLAYDAIDNYVYVAGRTSGAPLTYEFATLTRLSGADGSIGWSKTYDFEADSTSAVVDVDSEGHPVMVGWAYNGTDTYITTTKIDQADGNVVWSKSLNGQGDDRAYGMAIGPSNEIVTIGYADTFGQSSYTFVRTEDFANIGPTPIVAIVDLTGAYAVYVDTATISEGMIAKLLAIPTQTPTDITFADGSNSFTVTVTGVVQNGGRIEIAIGADSTQNDLIVANTAMWETFVSFTVAGVVDNFDRMIVVKYDTAGEVVWQKAVQFDTGYDCSGADADIDASGNIYVCGQYQYDTGNGTDSAMNLVKFNSSGVKQWSRRVVGNCQTFATSVVVGDDNNLYLSGITGNNNTGDYIWVVAKYDTDGLVTWQRLIDNTTTWTFGGTFWFSSGGGSNIAVKNGYIALAGAFGDPGTQPIAAVVQIDTDATPFSVGDWDLKGASFSGLLNSSASDITVVDADKVVGTNGPAVGDFGGGADFSNFLTAARYSSGSVTSSDLINGQYSLSLNNDGSVSFPNQSTNDRTGTADALVFARGNGGQKAIATQNATVNDFTVERLVIAGGDSYYDANANEWFGEGGDLYLWAGKGGGGGDIKVDAGNALGLNGDSGGTIKIRGGQSQSGTGGFIEITAGYSVNQNGGSVAITGGEGQLTGGDVTITGGYGTTTHGKIRLSTAGNTKKWDFGVDGGLKFPNNGGGHPTTEIYTTNGGSQYLFESYYNGERGTGTYLQLDSDNGVITIRPHSGTNVPQWQFNAGGTLTLPQGGTITESAGPTSFVGGLTLTVADVANFASPGSPGATVDSLVGSFTNDSWQYIQFGDWDVTAIQALVTDAGGSSNAVLPVTWGAGSTALTGFVLVQITGAQTFQMCPVVDAGAGANTPVSGTWFFNATIGGTTVAGPATIEVTATDNIILSTNNTGSPFDWTFGSTGTLQIPSGGTLTFPDTTVQTTAYVAPTTGNSVINSIDSSAVITRNGMTISITSAGILQMTFDSEIAIKGRTAINGGASTVIPAPNGDTTIGVAYPISSTLAADDHVVVTIVDSSFHNVYRVTAIIREQDTTPGTEFTTAYAIIEQLQ